MAGGTNILTLEFGNIGAVTAEYAGIDVLSDDYSVTLNVYLKGCADTYIELIAHLLGDNYSAELVEPSDNSCGFHKSAPFVFFLYFTKYLGECQ